MFYTIYKVTNNINGKFYIGQHRTNNLNDYYMGSGKLLLKAVKKHGCKNFTKEILHIFDNEEEMNAKEIELVELTANTYNMCEGGFGGPGPAKFAGEITKFKYNSNPEYREKINKEVFSKGTKALLEKFYSNSIFQDHMLNHLNNMKNLALSDTSYKKRKETFKKIIHQQGSKNSSFGSFWITDGINNKKIKEIEFDNWFLLGYYKGRIC